MPRKDCTWWDQCLIAQASRGRVWTYSQTWDCRGVRDLTHKQSFWWRRAGCEERPQPSMVPARQKFSMAPSDGQRDWGSHAALLPARRALGRSGNSNTAYHLLPFPLKDCSDGSRLKKLRSLSSQTQRSSYNCFQLSSCSFPHSFRWSMTGKGVSSWGVKCMRQNSQITASIHPVNRLHCCIP